MNKKFYFGILLLLLIVNISCNKHKNTEHKTMTLSSNWQFRQTGDTIWYPAKVPGTVHTDLFDNKLIPNPFYGLNEQKLQWIENSNWEYICHFNIDKNLFNKNHIELIFNGLDTYADIYLNNNKILQTDNMFRTWKCNAKKYLKKSRNELRIVFHSPMKLNIPKVDSLTYHLPAGNDRNEKKVSVFVRKAPYHFGWDWGPRFVTAGIWRTVKLQTWNTLKINNFQIYQQALNPQKAQLKALVQFKSDKTGTILILLKNGNKLISEKEISTVKGINTYQNTFEIKNPKLWWANGLGKANLYDFTVEIIKKNRLIDKKNTRFGIRTLEIVQKPDSIGKSFYFKLNGVPVFMKGANYIPQDNFLTRVDSIKYRKLITDAKRVNMNMLRVWGGGIYENDLFYDLCDENGILIWQDFMFACSMYPGDSAFLENVHREAIENVQRLRNHPSIALWCGNNEMQVAWERWGYQKTFRYTPEDSAKIYNDYLKIFADILPKVVSEQDSGRFYWPSSPNSAPSGWEEEARSGDFHYWGVWWGKEAFSAYKKYVGRFMSEYGFQSLPALSTIKKFAPDSSLYLVSPILKAHNKHPVGFETIDEYMHRYYRVPADFNNYVFMSQILQAEGMKTAIEAHRRAMPFCMGSLYWQLNDCWPVASWSSIDYYGRWKAFHYYLQKLYAQVLLSPIYENKTLKVFLISDYQKDKKVELKAVLMDFFGKPIWQKSRKITMKANSSHQILSESLNQIIEKYDKNKIFLHVELIENDKTIAENNLFFSKVKELALPHSEIQINNIRKNGKFGIQILSDVFVKNIFIDYENDTGCFSDNYFDLLPGELKTIWFNVKNPEKEIHKVRIKSLIERFNLPNLRNSSKQK